MPLIKFNIQDEEMQLKMLPLYQVYESEISEDELDEFYPCDSYEELYAYFIKYFTNKTTYIYEENDKYKGFVTYHVDCDEVPGYADGYDGWGTISEMYTEKQFRGLGLGKIMIEHAENELTAQGVNRIYLMNCLPENAGFWTALGYIDTGKIVPEEDGLIFEKYVG